MQEISKVVTSKGQPDVTVKIPQAESWKECIAMAKGEKEAIAIFNRQVVTDTMNKARKPASDPAAKALAAYLKNDKIPQAEKDKVKAALKAAGVSL